jgi:hypothetical protein
MPLEMKLYAVIPILHNAIIILMGNVRDTSSAWKQNIIMFSKYLMSLWYIVKIKYFPRGVNLMDIIHDIM